MTEREPGFYWVKRQGDWSVAELTDSGWQVMCDEWLFAGSEFEAIGPRIEKPEECK